MTCLEKFYLFLLCCIVESVEFEIMVNPPLSTFSPSLFSFPLSPTLQKL